MRPWARLCGLALLLAGAPAACEVSAACEASAAGARQALTGSEALSSFAAKYRIKYLGAPIRAKGQQELRQEADGSYIFLSSASWLFSSIKETSRFRLVDGQLQPLRYDYRRRGLGGRRMRFNAFNWEQGTVSHEAGSQPVAAGTLDKLLYQLQLRLDLKAALAAGDPTREFTYQLADQAAIKTYTFHLVGQETIETPAGELATCKLARALQEAGRQTTFWLAPQYDYLLAKLVQTEADGKGFRLELREVIKAP